MTADQFQKNAMNIETPQVLGDDAKAFDDDGKIKRTGTLLTASAHVITAVIGSGVLSLAWAIAQLGWVAGPIALFVFSIITYFTSSLLVDFYRSPDPVYGKRNYTYSEVVKNNLGGRQFQLCGLAQYLNLVGVTIGYTITASISMVAVERSNCFHKHGHGNKCYTSNNPYMIIFGCIQIVLSQIPSFHKISGLSIVAAIMSFAYSSIGFGLSIAKVASGAHARTTLTGVEVGVDVTASDKLWRVFQALGNIAFAYTYSNVLIEIQDTLKAGPPENKVMKKASMIGISVTTIFYVLCGTFGYAAFGNDAPGNFLTGFGFYEPFWLIDFANICIAVHLVGAYQVFVQPIFGAVEKKCSKRWPDNKFIHSEYDVKVPACGSYELNLFRLVWRSIYVVFSVLLAMLFPFFNDIVGLVGSISFFPLTVYFPVEMYMKRTNMRKWSLRWTSLKLMNWVCLIISLIAAVGSIQGLFQDVKKYKPFKPQQ